jgi:hypothetical protein
MALNLKLDAVMENQILIANAMKVLQDSIDELQRQVPGFITDETYRLMWESADSIFNEVKLLNERTQKPEDNLQDFNKVFDRLYAGINDARSRILTTTTGTQGVASILKAGQAIYLYMQVAYVVLNFEARLPAAKRWRNQHATKYAELARNLRAACAILLDNRIPEALAEQRSLQKSSYETAAATPWGSNLKRMYEGAQGATRDAAVGVRPVLDVCFVSRPYSVSPDGQVPYWARQTAELTITYSANLVNSWNKDDLIFSEVKTTPKASWDMQTWQLLGGQAINTSSLKTRAQLKPGAAPCNEVTRRGSADLLQPDVLDQELSTFEDNLVGFSDATLHAKVLEELNKLAQKIDAETVVFETQVASKAASDSHSAIDAILDFFKR